ncbi:hypothetical protein [Micromonospora yangpuensis]|uniref:hypothetical protein n=1 Tax=Micromonospora yangpuensis TaxID=683228 RepID=UPI0019BBEA3D|nr:hypothetical protein [Micromonospora yangpuensis]GGM16312.1 hypothetical protein GCM10012279_38040 [Micromonospora yangpuensis]
MTYDPSSSLPTSDQPTHDLGVRDQARQVGAEAAHTGGAVAQHAREQGREVVDETARQARNLYGETRT